MGAHRGYVTAVVAGAMTAGIAASNVLATPPERAVSADVDLAAATTIPIIDIGPTPGPLSIWRQLAIQVGTDPLLLGLIQSAGNTYDLPGLFTTVDSDTNWLVKATQGAGFIDFGASSDQAQTGSWDLLGIVGSSADTTNARNIHFMPLLGGSGGIGAALFGTLGDSTLSRNVNVLGSQLGTEGQSTFGDFNGQLALLPWDGFKVVAGGTDTPTPGEPPPPATLIDTNRVTAFNLGSFTGEAKSDVTLDGGAGLCLGSAKASCGGNTAFLEVGAPVTGGLTIAGRNIISGDFADNRIVSTLGNGEFSVTGAIGGTVKVGSLSIGQAIPINIQIPGAASMMSSTSSRQQQNVRNSFLAVPGNPGSNNASASTGRHAARDFVNSAISDVKTTVNKVVNSKPKHAKPDTESDSAA
jgi:hypothetical protein